MTVEKKVQVEQAQLSPIPLEIIEKIISEHESNIIDRMGHLYNRFVAYIAEAQVPINQVVTVLSLLLRDALTIAEKRYKGGD